MTLASQRTFFGPNNPFEKHPELMDDFWDWEAGNITYMAGFFPSIFACKATRGLKANVKGLEEYIKADGYKDAYKILQDHDQLHLQMASPTPTKGPDSKSSLHLASPSIQPAPLSG